MEHSKRNQHCRNRTGKAGPSVYRCLPRDKDESSIVKDMLFLDESGIFTEVMAKTNKVSMHEVQRIVDKGQMPIKKRNKLNLVQ